MQCALKRYSITEEDVKFRFNEILKVNVFQDPLILVRNYMRRSISIENISFSRNCDIKITNSKMSQYAISMIKDRMRVSEETVYTILQNL